MLKEAAVAQFELLTWYLLCGIEEPHKTLSRDDYNEPVEIRNKHLLNTSQKG
jgi:hypothetical protein